MGTRAGRFRRPDLPEGLFLLSSLLVATLHLYIAVAATALAIEYTTQFVLLSVLLLVVPGLFFTRVWHPIYYLFHALLTCSLGVVWLLDGMNNFPVGVATGVPATIVVVLSAYLFLRAEEPSR